MFNSKKILLSLVTAVALSSSGVANSYLPLTSDTNDNRWIMFGVNGFHADGATSAVSADFTDYGLISDTQITDNTVDEVGVSGLLATSGDLTTALAEVKVLNLPSNALSAITVNFDATAETFSATEPTRTMYIKAGGSDNADVMFTYKASLEGKTLEFQIGGSTETYTTTISALNTFSNPATRTLKTGIAATTENELTTITETMDFDFADNPRDPADYNRVANADNPVGHQTTDADASTRMYEYNANTQSWEIYDSANSVLANDFLELKKGKGYWAKVDLNDNDSSDAQAKAGLVLGATGLQDSDYVGELAEGWNLLSFDEAKPDIRTSSTGMIITIAAGAIKLYDSTGVNNVDVTLTGTPEDDAKLINLAIAGAKSRGEFSDVFDLTALRVSATQILLVSNKRFTVQDVPGTAITAGITMAGKNLWDEATDGLVDYSGTTFPTTGVSSVYGESALVIKPLVGPGTAAELDSTVQTAIGDGAGTARSAKIQVGTNSAVHLADVANDTASTLTTATARLGSDATIDLASEIDIDNDGTNDHIIIAADEPFYIRDHTFTRVLTYDPTSSGNLIKVASPTPASVTTAATIVGTVTNINGVADAAAATDTGVYAAVTNVNDILFVTAVDNANNFTVFDDVTEDYLVDTTSSDDLAKGAVKGVYSVNYLAKRDVVPHLFSTTVFNSGNGLVDDATDTITPSVNGAVGSDIDPTIPIDTTAKTLAVFDAIVAQIRSQIKTAGIDAVVEHDYTEAADNVATAEITVTGYGVTSLAIPVVDNGGVGDQTAANVGVDANAATAGALDNPSPNLTADLKYNAIYTPDYAKDGPLYTLKGQGFTPLAFVTGSTEMSSGVISWSNIDLTRAPSNWFTYDNGEAHNDYNLFSIDGKTAYWVYLETNPDTNSLAISDVTLYPSYTHHFNNNLTTINHVAATLQLTVSGLPSDTESVNVYANVGGSNISLASSSDDGVYSASLSSYEVQNLASGGIRDITVSVADGLGYKLEPSAVASIDFEKPATPTVVKNGDGTININSTSADASGYYIFKTAIPEENTKASSNLVAKVLSTDASSYNLCATNSAFGLPVTYRAIAMDGLSADTGAAEDGELGYGNASDAVEFVYSPILNGSTVLSNIEGIDSGATSLGTTYDSSCAASVVETTNSGVSVKSIISDTQVKLAYVANDTVSFSTDTPLTIYVGLSSAGLAEIKYVPAYAGETFYILLNGKVYSGTFPSEDNTNGDSSSALDVSGNMIVGQSF